MTRRRAFRLLFIAKIGIPRCQITFSVRKMPLLCRCRGTFWATAIRQRKDAFSIHAPPGSSVGSVIGRCGIYHLMGNSAEFQGFLAAGIALKLQTEVHHHHANFLVKHTHTWGRRLLHRHFGTTCADWSESGGRSTKLAVGAILRGPELGP